MAIDGAEQHLNAIFRAAAAVKAAVCGWQHRKVASKLRAHRKAARIPV